jgi:hypothetical protein
MTLSDDADETVTEQGLRPHLRTRRLSDHARFQIDGPSRSGPLSLSGFGTKRIRTPGASVPTRAMRPSPKFSTKPSLVRSVKVRMSRSNLSCSAGRRTASASCTSGPTRARSSSARGVGTRPRPALTSSGSPVASRTRASARLIAEGLSRNLWAARATLPSVSSTSR